MKHHPPRPHRLIPFAIFFAAVACASTAAQSSSASGQTASPTPQTPAAAVREKLNTSVALVEHLYSGDNGTVVSTVGSLGVYLREDVLVTTREQVVYAQRLRVRALDGPEAFEVRGVVCTDTARELILLRLKGARGRPPEFADPAAVRAGDVVNIVSNDGGDRLTIHESRAGATQPAGGGVGPRLEVEPPGSRISEGSVIADADGSPLGLVTPGSTTPTDTLTAVTFVHLAPGGGAAPTRPAPQTGDPPPAERQTATPELDDDDGCAAWLADERAFERDASVREKESQRLQILSRYIIDESGAVVFPASRRGTKILSPPMPPADIVRPSSAPPPRDAPPEMITVDVAGVGEIRPDARHGGPAAGRASSAERRPSPPPPVTSQPPTTSTSVTEVREEYAVVRVFYGTDRKQTGSPRADKFYGGERSPRDTYEAGVCDVTIPKTHKTGQLEAPSILRLEFRADPARHVILQSVTPLGREEFFSGLRERFAQTGGAHALVFIHGFNVTFEDAARRTAQIAYDLGFNGVPLMYSWPSRGSLLGYRRDEESVKLAVPHLKQFLEDVAAELGPGARIHLIAHSMGNRALTNALRGIAADERPSPLFNQVILTAPDIDADVFLNEIAPAIQKTAAQVTLYASSDDKALAAGRRINGKPRAGESGDYILTIPGIVTVDASGIDTSLLGHSYYAELKSVLDDMDAIMRHGHGPAERKLRALTRGSATYWSLLAAAATAAVAAEVPVASPPPGTGGGAWVVPSPALLLLASLVLAAIVFLFWRLIRRRRGAG